MVLPHGPSTQSNEASGKRRWNLTQDPYISVRAWRWPGG
jgi:hypothetical protein